MDIIRMPIVKGLEPTLLEGTDRYAYALSDFEDAWNLEKWQRIGGYQGMVLYLYDLQKNTVYVPFEKKRNVIYQKPLFFDDRIYILQIDYDAQSITLYRVSPDAALEKVTDLSTDAVNLYNIALIGEDVHIISHDETFVCYYPDIFEITLAPNESVVCIEDDRVYIRASIDEGAGKAERDTPYAYYEKTLVKDKMGNLISEDVGTLTRFPDGKWRIF